MEIGIVGILIFFGATASFLSAVLTGLSQDRLNEIIEENYKAAQLLQDLKAKFEDNISPFQIIEVVIYSIAGVMLGIWVSQNYEQATSYVISIALFAASVLFLRYIFQALGFRWADGMAGGLSSLLGFVSFITNPLFLMMRAISEAIIGDTNEDDSRDEINQLVESAREEGSIDDDEYRILKNIMHFISSVCINSVEFPDNAYYVFYILSFDVFSSIKMHGFFNFL